MGSMPVACRRREVIPYYDRSWLIGETLKTVFSNLLEGAALVMLVLYIFLADLPAAGSWPPSFPGLARNLHSPDAGRISRLISCHWGPWTSRSCRWRGDRDREYFPALGKAHKDEDHRPHIKTSPEAVVEG